VTETAEDDQRSRTRWLKSPQTIARVLGLLLFGLLFWIESPPLFLRHAGIASYTFIFLLWLGELLVYAIGIAGVLVILVFAGSHVYHLLRNARRWYRLQEIRSWRAKRPCNYRSPPV
jgi:cytochrome c biogenesis protein CcdA